MKKTAFAFTVQKRIDGIWFDAVIGAETFEEAVIFFHDELREDPAARLRIVAKPYGVKDAHEAVPSARSRAALLLAMPAAEMRLRFGELTAAEIRTVRSVAKWVAEGT